MLKLHPIDPVAASIEWYSYMSLQQVSGLLNLCSSSGSSWFGNRRKSIQDIEWPSASANATERERSTRAERANKRDRGQIETRNRISSWICIRNTPKYTVYSEILTWSRQICRHKSKFSCLVFKQIWSVCLAQGPRLWSSCTLWLSLFWFRSEKSADFWQHITELHSPGKDGSSWGWLEALYEVPREETSYAPALAHPPVRVDLVRESG